MNAKFIVPLACAALAAAAPVAGAQTLPAETAPVPTVAEAQSTTATVTEKSEPAQAMPSNGVQIPAPPAGKGQIVFFRPGRFIGAAVSWKLLDGTTELGKVGNARYLVVTMEPGLHDLVMDFGTKGKLRIEVDAEETYYIECGIAMGVLVNHPDLIPSTRDGFDSISAKLKPAKTAKLAEP
jgi:hypothetical protein